MPKILDEKTIKTIRRLLSKGVMVNEVARRCGVPHSTVSNIKKTDDFIMELTPIKFHEVQSMVLAGFPTGVIELRTQIPCRVIHAITLGKVAYGKLGPGMFARECCKCGAVIVPPPGNSRGIFIHKEPLDISRQQACELFGIAEDIVALQGQNLIANQLFYNLAQDAIKVLSTIGAVPYEEEKEPERDY
jgi:hypothetical protein